MNDIPTISKPSQSTPLERLGKQASRLLWLGVAFGVAWFGEHEKDGGFMKDLWEQAKIASPFAAMLCLWLLLDQMKERREAQEQCNERTIDYINSNNVASRALEKMADSTAEKRRSYRT